MKKIYTMEKFIKVGKDNFTHMSIWDRTYYIDEEEAKRRSEPVTVETFDQLVKAIEQNYILVYVRNEHRVFVIDTIEAYD